MAKKAVKSTSKKPAARKTTRPVRRTPSPVATEVKHLGVAALGILLMLSMFVRGAAGFLGQFIERLLAGLFGFGAYILPFVVIALAIYGLFSRARRITPHVAVKAAIFFWCLIALIHVVAMPEPEGYPGVWAYFQDMYQSGSVSNGGLTGALLGNLLRSMLGMAGACIVLVVCGLIALLLLTGRSFVGLVSVIVNGLRNFTAGLQNEWVEEVEEVDDEEFDDVPPPDKRRELKPLPARSSKKKPAGQPELLVIEDKPEHSPKRVLLVNEEISMPPHPILKPRKRKEEPALFETSHEPATLINIHPEPHTPTRFKPEPEFRRAPEPITLPEPENIVDLPDIMLKGMVSPGAVSEEDELDDFDDIPAETMPLFDEEDDFSSKPPRATITPFPTSETIKPKPKPVAKMESVPSVSLMPRYEDYQFPPISLLTKNESVNPTGSRTQLLENSRILEETLKSFRVEAKVIEVSAGPTVTRYDLVPGPGVKVSAIANLSNDLALSLAAQGIRIEAPIPGKAAVGIEIPNKEPRPVLLREIIEDDTFTKYPSRLAFAVGKDIAGDSVVADVGRMPHLLIAGATGSGKSVCINTLITSLLYKSRPDEVKLLMIDPKVVELSVYNGIPHLLIPVVTDPKKASGALQWAVAEMDNRYGLFAEAGVRDLKGYNAYRIEEEEEDAVLPQIVIIIDELADLMMVCKGDVEESICRLAQKARAAGIHLIVATQRPSVDVITGLIKANIPSRLAFAVSSGIDSRTVLDTYGAEKLLGKGDMLFLPMGKNKPIRLQGGFISDKEVEGIVDFLKKQTVTVYPQEMIEQVTTAGRPGQADEDLDEFFHEAVEFLIEKGKASTSMLQRQFRIGYNRASRLMEDLETRGIVGPEDGVKPRKIMMSREEFYNMYG